MNKIKIKLIVIMTGFFLAALIASGCGQKEDSLLTALGSENKGELLLTFHDEPLGKDHDVKKINLNIIETQIIDFYDKKTVISDQSHSFNLLDLTANNPVVLAHTFVGAGTYKQIRLILDGNSTIELGDGSIHPLKVPSGEFTGVKIDGVFTIPEGKLYTLDIDLNPNHSIHYTPGQGYMLKPVVKLTGIDVLQGNFYYSLPIVGGEEYITQIQSNGTLNVKFSRLPQLLATGSYIFDGLQKTMDMRFTELSCNLCTPEERTEFNKLGIDVTVMDKVKFVSEWGKDYLVLGDSLSVNEIKMVSIPSFDFSAAYAIKKVTINVNFNSSEYADNAILASLYPSNHYGDYFQSAAVINSDNTAQITLPIQLRHFDSDTKEFQLYLTVAEHQSDIHLGLDAHVERVDNVLASNSEIVTFELSRNEDPTTVEVNFEPATN